MNDKNKKIILSSVLLLAILIFSINSLSAASIDVVTKDSYNETSKKYNETGYVLSNASVTVTDSANVLIYNGTTGNDGKLSINSLNVGNYKLNISYSTYSPYTTQVKINSTSDVAKVSHTFIPDIAFVVYYSGHTEKIDRLMNISKRIYYINSYPDFDWEKVWLLDYAQFIYLDMYSETRFDFTYELFQDTPANHNFKIAYCFGVYTNYLINKMELNFIGANSSNNTPHTLENTYIGSYFQAEDSEYMEEDVLNQNMKNLFDYLTYLLGDSHVNPTLNSSRTPQLDMIWGLYHPDFGIWEFKPTQSQINQWINANPGYNADTIGSLNWMTVEYAQWLESKNITELFDDFESWYSSKNINTNYIAIASYNPGGTLVDELIHSYESNGRATFNVFQKISNPSMASILLSLSESLSKPIVAINSLYSWSLDYENMGEGGAIDAFTEMNIEVIRAVHDISQYSYLSEFGPQAEWTYAVTIPSFEGVFGAIPASYRDENGTEHVIKEGADKVVETTLGWVNLKEKDNVDKKVAVILYNYPPGKSEIGASYLDVFQSLHDLLEHMYDDGYDIGMEKNEIPNATELYTIISAFGNKGTWAQGYLTSMVQSNWDSFNDNGQLVNLTQYMKYFNSLDSKLQQELVDYWGNGLGDIMVYNDSYIVIPGLVTGNVFITFQPSRGWEEVENYHDIYLPPHQQYVTFYKWLDDVFGADAMIHLGTHGTLEFLPGRSIGLQSDDWTFELMGIPNIYPYIVSNPGEALVAKERAGALVISHMTPATVISALYGDLVHLKDRIMGYNSAINSLSYTLAESIKEEILNLTNSLYIDGPSENQSFSQWLEELHHLLEDLDNDIITLGLHSLGYVLTGEEMIQEVITIVSSKTTVYNDIKNLLYPGISDTYYEMIHSTKYTNETKIIQEWFTSFITGLLNGSITSISDFATGNGISLTSDFYSGLLLCNNTILNIQNNMEWESIMKALSGEYVLPGLAADPSYGESLPTGKNIYSVDTTKIPSSAAWEAAKKIVDKLLVEYYEENGEFPELVGLVMWGTELLRTEGIGIGEFLYFLGVKPTWTPNGVASGVELIPLNELTITLSDGSIINRPRIDVFASAVTSNVDWIKLMVNALNLVNDADESTTDNYVKKHYEEFPSLDRIFGLPGAILEGTGMSDYIPNTAKWEDSIDLSADLAEIYLSRVSYAWSIDSNGKLTVNQNRELYEYLLKNVDLITQNIDSTWRFLDSDDYYDWFGGMLGASQYLGGNPDTAVVDIRNKNDMVSRTLEEQLEFEIRSTVLNPTYQIALLGTASGWLEYASKYEYIYGFAHVAKGSDGQSLISDNTWSALADNLLDSKFADDADYKAYGYQSMSALLIQTYREGMWSGVASDGTNLIDELITRYSESVINYGVACCHHTCANLEFHLDVAKMYTGISLNKAIENFDSSNLDFSDIDFSKMSQSEIESAIKSKIISEIKNEISSNSGNKYLDEIHEMMYGEIASINTDMRENIENYINEAIREEAYQQIETLKYVSENDLSETQIKYDDYLDDLLDTYFDSEAFNELVKNITNPILANSSSSQNSKSSESESGNSISPGTSSNNPSSPGSSSSSGGSSSSSGGSSSSSTSSGSNNPTSGQSDGATGSAKSFSGSSSGESGDFGEAHEVSENQNSSNEDPNMSIAFIAAVIALIALFVVGYLRNKKEDDF